MKAENLEVECRCGFVHKDFAYIRFVRDRLNQRKAYCTRCNRRVFVCRYAFQSSPEKQVMIR